MRTRASGHTSGRSGLYALSLLCLPVLLLAPSLAVSQASQPSSTRRTLHSVNEVYGLTSAEAAKGYPIDLEGIVTYSDPEWGVMFIQDKAVPTFIDSHGFGARLPAGTRVRVEAVTGANSQGPAVVHPRISVLGKGTIPTAENKSLATLDTGTGESSLVLTEGVLHPCERNYRRVCFRIYDGKSAAWLVVPEPDGPAAQSLIGAVVRVRAVLGRHLDDANQSLGAQLYVNSLDDIQVLEAPAVTGYLSPVTTTRELRAADADQRFVRQVHLRGMVTWQSEGLFSIQDGSGTAFVSHVADVAVPTGAVVDAIGFPSHGPFGLEISDSAIRVAAVQPSPTDMSPLVVTAAEVVQRSLNGKRVRLKARLIGQSANATEIVYQLEQGTQRFNAILLRNSSTRETAGLSRDAILEITGVALVQKGGAAWPGTLLVLIESPKDVVVRGGVGWLTLKRGLTILGFMAICVMAPLIWVNLLRRTVRQQTAIIRTRLESELRLETKYSRLVERNLAGVFSARPDGTIVDCNLAFARMLGFDSREAPIGRSFHDFRIDSGPERPLVRVIPDEAKSNVEVSLRRDDGAIVHLLMNITPVHAEEGMLYETTAIDVTQLRQNQAELQRAKDTAVFESLNDPLTGLPNRKLLSQTLASHIVEAEKDGASLALLYLDLDGFKLVNDSLGHAVGDGLLVQVAARLRSWVRDGDMLARLGGDEFMVIMHKISGREDALMLAENLLEEVSSSFEVKEHTLAIGACIGISVFPDDATDAEQLIQQADGAMYIGKREGKNRVTCYTPEIGTRVHERLTLEHLLRGAIARNEISVHYQPEFSLADDRLTRFEALARWTHPTLGKIPPLKFIPVAEESGLIWALGAYIMEKACTEALRWQKMMTYPIQVAVNVSAVQFRRKGFVEEVSAILDRTGLRPGLLQIEVTESVLLAGAQQTAETVGRLREMGISLAIDDFGTGYSSLSYLPTLSFDVLKIDRSFVVNTVREPETVSMIRTLIVLAHNFGMQVIVEGVETPEQLALVKSLGANEVQGFLNGRPTADPLQYMLRNATL